MLDSLHTVRQVRLTFDVPFDQYKYGYMEQPLPTSLVSDFSLAVLTEQGEWQTVSHTTDNIQRLVVLDITPTMTKGVRITVQKAADCSRAIIPEIRIY